MTGVDYAGGKGAQVIAHGDVTQQAGLPAGFALVLEGKEAEYEKTHAEDEAGGGRNNLATCER